MDFKDIIIVLMLLLSAFSELCDSNAKKENALRDCSKAWSGRIHCRSMLVTNDLRQHTHHALRLVHHPEHVSEMKTLLGL